MARPHLRRSLARAAAVTSAGHLFRGFRTRPLPDHVRATLLAHGIVAVDLRMECCRAGSGARRDCRRRVVFAARRAVARHLGLVRQRGAAGADRQAVQRLQHRWGEGAGAGRAADLSRSVAAGLGTHQMAHQRHARPDPNRPSGDRATRSLGLEGACIPLVLLERHRRRKRGSVEWARRFSCSAKIPRYAGYGVERVGPQDRSWPLQPCLGDGL